MQTIMEDQAVDVTRVKHSVINDFEKFIHRLNMGHQDCYQHILAKIAYIENAPLFSNSIYEKITSYE
jgi:hypothetical protein